MRFRCNARFGNEKFMVFSANYLSHMRYRIGGNDKSKNPSSFELKIIYKFKKFKEKSAFSQQNSVVLIVMKSNQFLAHKNV